MTINNTPLKIVPMDFATAFGGKRQPSALEVYASFVNALAALASRSAIPGVLTMIISAGAKKMLNDHLIAFPDGPVDSTLTPEEQAVYDAAKVEAQKDFATLQGEGTADTAAVADGNAPAVV